MIAPHQTMLRTARTIMGKLRGPSGNPARYPARTCRSTVRLAATAVYLSAGASLAENVPPSHGSSLSAALEACSVSTSATPSCPRTALPNAGLTKVPASGAKGGAVCPDEQTCSCSGSRSQKCHKRTFLGWLPSRAADPILRLRLDRSASVRKVTPHFVPHGAAYLLRQCCECLAGGRPTAFKGAVIDIE